MELPMVLQNIWQEENLFLLNTNKKKKLVNKSHGILQNQENDNFICQKQ